MKEKIERQLEITVRINEDNFEVDVYEPESGAIAQFQRDYDDYEKAVEEVGTEIWSWVSLWRDEE